MMVMSFGTESKFIFPEFVLKQQWSSLTSRFVTKPCDLILVGSNTRYESYPTIIMDI